MRRLEFATLLMSAVSFVAVGCRQTTGPSTAGPTGPLSPVATGQTPTLNPFGGPTRVTPPSTGSFSAPNTYIGGPPGQANVAPIAPSGFAAAPGQAPVGSGVQPTSGVQAAGWTETGSNVANPTTQSGFGANSFTPSPSAGTVAPSAFGSTAPSAFGSTAPSAFGSTAPSAFGSTAPSTAGSPAAPTSPQLGGMEVIDLTGAPPPPGYQPTQPNYQPSAPGVAPMGAPTSSGFQAPPSNVPAGQSGFQPSTGFQSAAPAASYQPQPQPATGYPTQQSFQSVPEAEIAARMNPIPAPNTPAAAPTTTGPSTDPVNSDSFQNGSSANLPWRRPGTSY